MGKIYDLLFVRVVKLCAVSSFDTKEIKLDSINSRALECPADKSDVENLHQRKSSRTWLPMTCDRLQKTKYKIGTKR